MIDEDQLILEDDTAKVFLSYSRRDRDNAQRIADVLRERHFGVFRDTDDILPTEEWKGRLEQLIAEADTVVFLLSPNSVASEVCAWEVEHATSLNKRIAPIVIEEVDTAAIPPLLARLNFIFCTARDRFQDAVDSLVSALGTDIDWIREHTRLAGLAARWARADQPGRLLLRGQDITDAESWRDEHPADAPAVTPIQATFIRDSRRAATRRQRLVVVFSLAGAVLAAGLAGYAFLQREAAIDNERRALANEQRAVENQLLAERQRDQAQTNESLLLTSFAEDELAKAFPVEAALLALEAVPDQRSADLLTTSRPLVDPPLAMLRRAERNIREQAILYQHAGAVHQLAVSEDGNRIATISIARPDRDIGSVSLEAAELIVYDFEQNQVVRRVVNAALRGNSGAPSFDASATRVAVSGAAGAVHIYNVDQPGPPLVVNTPAESIDSVLLAADASTVFVSTRSDRLLAVDSRTGDVKFERPGGRAVLSPDGRAVAATHDDLVVLYDTSDGTQLGQVGPVRGPLSGPRWLQFSANGERLAAQSEHVVWVLDARAVKILGKAPTRKQSVSAVHLSPNGKLLGVGGADGVMSFYDLDSRKNTANYRGHRQWLFDVDLGPKQSVAVTSAIDGSIQVWRLGDKRPLQLLNGHVGPVKRVLLRDDNSVVVSAGEDGTVRRWKLPPGLGRESLVNEFAGDPILSSDGQLLALSKAGVFNFADGRLLTALSADRHSPVFLAFTLNNTALIGQPVDPQTGDMSKVCVYVLPDVAVRYCVGDADTVNIFNASADPSGHTLAVMMAKDGPDVIATFDVRSGQALGRIEFNAYASDPQKRRNLSDPIVSADGASVFIRSQESVLIYDRTLGTQTGSIELTRPGTRLVFSSDHRLLLALTASQAELWDVPEQRLLTRYALPNRTVVRPVISATGDYLATVAPDGALVIRHLRTGELVARFGSRDELPMRAPVFSTDARYVMATREFAVLLWELPSGQLLDTIRTGAPVPHPSIFAKAVSNDGKRVTTWSWDGPQQWPLLRTPQAIVEYVQARVPRCLSPAQRRTLRLPENPPRWCLTGPGLEHQSDKQEWQPRWPYTRASDQP